MMFQDCTISSNQLIDSYWLSVKLANGCNCTNIRDENLIYNLHCESFPFNHDIPIQLFYIFIFSFIILLAVCGNFTVIWLVFFFIF